MKCKVGDGLLVVDRSSKYYGHVGRCIKIGVFSVTLEGLFTRNDRATFRKSQVTLYSQ